MSEIILLILAGLVLLLVSGKFLVDSSVSISSLFRIPSMIVGLTVVAMGTSAPELLVSIKAAVSAHPEIAMGNVVGSNISNILLILALTAIIFPVKIPALSVRRDWPVMMGVTLLVYLFSRNMALSRFEGLMLLILLLLYIFFSINQAGKGKGDQATENSGNSPGMKWWLALPVFAVSCAGLALGADLLVENAATLARHFGVSERAVAVSMVAVGTSLPELVTSLIAAFKKETDIALGNIIGSNIMNILAVLGIAGIIRPMTVSLNMVHFDMLWMIGSAVLLFLFMIPARNGKITRLEGIIMLSAYLCYLYLVF
ncbi:MAG: calcium/sodium antiporter [Bacteroidota bacterium]